MEVLSQAEINQLLAAINSVDIKEPSENSGEAINLSKSDGSLSQAEIDALLAAVDAAIDGRDIEEDENVNILTKAEILALLAAINESDTADTHKASGTKS